MQAVIKGLLVATASVAVATGLWQLSQGWGGEAGSSGRDAVATASTMTAGAGQTGRWDAEATTGPAVARPGETMPMSGSPLAGHASDAAALKAAVRIAVLDVGRMGAQQPPVALMEATGQPARHYLVGDSISPGVRLKAIAAAYVEVERGAVTERLELPQRRAASRLLPLSPPVQSYGAAAVAQPSPVVTPVVMPPNETPRSSTGVDRAVERAMERVPQTR